MKDHVVQSVVSMDDGRPGHILSSRDVARNPLNDLIHGLDWLRLSGFVGSAPGLELPIEVIRANFPILGKTNLVEVDVMELCKHADHF